MNELLNYTLKDGVIVKNRFVLAPMTTYASNDDLTLSEEERIYYETRGKEFGMVITAATAVSKHAQAFTNQISIQSRKYLASMRILANSIKKGGALAVLQLHHGGRMNLPGLYENQDIVSASSVKADRDYAVKPRALETEEVYQIIKDFKDATLLAMEAGFDGVELHGANTYLLQQFFSPHSNQRTDEFGGSLEKRYTFIDKLIDEVHQCKEINKNPSFIIGYRLSPEELETPGITLEDTKYLVRQLSNKPIDYIHLSLGSYKQSSLRNPQEKTPIITVLKEANQGSKPMIGVGGVLSLDQAKEAFALGFDMIAIGMAALADEHVVTHLLNGNPIKKTIDQSSKLPKPMKERLQRWKKQLIQRGYEIK